MIALDGNYGEGGGQIIRTALALSALTGKPFEVNNIRSGRKESGLKAQHLYCVKAVQQLCDGKVEGAELGSKFLKFEPGKIKSKTLNIDIGTAGSITLLLQSLLLPAFFAEKPIKIKLTGGTDVAWSMPIDYLREVLLPQLKKFCEKIEIKTLLRGYYPKGGGKVELRITPKYSLQDFDALWKKLQQEMHKITLVNQGKLIAIKGVSHASKDLEKAEVAERQARSARHALSTLNCPVKIESEYSETSSTGSGITLWAIFESDEFNPVIIGADALGELGKPAETVGREAAKNLLEEINSKAAVDAHLSDNLVPWMALFCPSRITVSRITPHTTTNIYVVEKFLGKLFRIDGNIISSERG